MGPDSEVVVRLRLKDAQRFFAQTSRASHEVAGVGHSAHRANREFKQAAYGGRIFGRSMYFMSRAAIYGGTALGVTGLALGVKGAIQAFQEKRKILADTQAALKSTGGAAGVTEKQIDSLSTSLSRVSGKDDEAIRDLQNRLLTFPEIQNRAGKGNQIFTRTTRDTLDFAVKKHMDLAQAAEQVGKALNMPAKGYARLQRQGVQFNKTQEALIKFYDQTGQKQKAQRIILRELEKEFGGQAKAQATAMDKLHVSINNVQETLGAVFSPAVDAASRTLDNFFNSHQPSFDRWERDTKRIFGRKRGFGKNLQDFFHVTGRDLGPVADDFEQALKDAHLGDKLENAVIWAAPKIADGFAHAAPKAAAAFAKAWWNADIWGKLIVAGVVGKKLGLWRIAGAKAGGAFEEGMATTMLPGMASQGTKGGAMFATAFRAAAILGLADLGAEAIGGLKDALGLPRTNPKKKGGPKPLDWLTPDTLLPNVHDIGKGPIFHLFGHGGGAGLPFSGGQTFMHRPQGGGPAQFGINGPLGTLPSRSRIPGVTSSAGRPQRRRPSPGGQLTLRAEAPIIVQLDKRELGRGVAKIVADERARK